MSCLSIALASSAHAQITAAQTTIHDFNGADGNMPWGLIQGTDGNFYGTTAGGGANNEGTVLKMTPAGVVTTLHSFSDSDGYEPLSSVIQAVDGNFYGTTHSGGAHGLGTLYQLRPDGTFNVLHNFAGNPDGSYPFAALLQAGDGNFYGATNEGGMIGDNGEIFKLTSAGTVTDFHDWTGTIGTAEQTALIEGRDGNLYGTTSQGGAASPANSGIAFQITLGGTVTVLHIFATADGVNPSPLLEGSDGNLYGTTNSGGGSGLGTVFRLTPAGAFTVLHDFGSVEGAHPGAALIQGTDGNFYGTTQTGTSSGLGGAFQITPAGSYTLLYTFFGVHGDNPNAALLQARDGNLYGTTEKGGANGYGTAFVLMLSPEITSPATATATAGQPFTYQIAATGNPTSYGANGLPVGLSLDPAAGMISGTPMAVGTFAVGLSAQNSGGTGSETLTLTVAAATSSPTPPPGGSLIQEVDLLSPPTDITVLVGQTINLYVSVETTPGGLKGVEFFAGSTDLGGSTAARDNKTWMPSVPGDYLLQAVATDVNGVQATTHETIHVQAPQANVAAPGAALLSGLDGRSFAPGATVQLVASATDANGAALQSVQFYADGVPISASGVTQATGRVHAQDASGGGYYRASLQLGALIKDTLLTMVATNAQGIASVSRGATIHTTSAPVGDTLSCAITAPSATNALTPSGSTAATVNALEPGGNVAKVEFFVNSTSIGTATASPYTFTIPAQTAGAYALTAIATDTAGLSKVSAPVIVSVTPPTVDIAVSGPSLVPGGSKGVLVVTRTGDPGAALDVFIKAKGPAIVGMDYKPLPTKVTILAGATKAKLKVKTLADPDNTGKRKLKLSLLPVSDGSYVTGTAATVKLSIGGGG